MKNRLFIALKLPDYIVEQIDTVRKSLAGENEHKWEPKDKLHMTLKFLGDVDDSLNPKISETMEGILSHTKKIGCELDRFGFFMPRILWISLTPDEHLYKIVNAFESEFAAMGFPKEERKFKPHITLLRIKKKLEPEFVSAFNKYKLPKDFFLAEEIDLMKSELKPSGSVYTSIRNFKLL